MSLVYVLSPYSHTNTKVMHRRYRAVMCYVNLRLFENPRKFFFSPIVYFHKLAFKYNLPTSAEFWDRQNQHMIAIAKNAELLMLPGWEDSKGIHEHELPALKKLGIEVTHVRPTEEVLSLVRGV